MNLLLLFLPDEALILVIVAAGFALMCGYRQAAGTLLLLALLLPLLGPVIESLMMQAPVWLSLMVLLTVGMMLLRAMTSLFLGDRATDHMIGILAADVVRLFLSALLWPLRMLSRSLRSLLR